MSYEQYWYGDPYMVRDYDEAQRLRIQQKNFEMWIQGQYNLEALGVVMNAAFGKKGGKTVKYPNKPYDLFPQKKKAVSVQKMREQLHAQLAAAHKQYLRRKRGDG